jgi:hypothetical protein
MSTASALLAHQGGWDEFLLVAVPIVVIIGLLALVKRRVDSAARHADDVTTDDVTTDDGPAG